MSLVYTLYALALNYLLTYLFTYSARLNVLLIGTINGRASLAPPRVGITMVTVRIIYHVGLLWNERNELVFGMKTATLLDAWGSRAAPGKRDLPREIGCWTCIIFGWLRPSLLI